MKRNERKDILLNTIYEKQEKIENLGYDDFQNFIYELQENEETPFTYNDFQKRLIGYHSQKLDFDIYYLQSFGKIKISDSSGPIVTKLGEDYLKLAKHFNWIE